MMTTADYLDAIKAKLGLTSDYAVSKVLGVRTSSVSRYRNGVSAFDDEVCFKVGELLDVNPLEVIVAVRAERALNDDARSRWEGYWEKFSQSFPLLVSRADARQLRLWPV